MTPTERVARAICETDGYDPDRLEPGDDPYGGREWAEGLPSPCIDGYNRKDEPCHFFWRHYHEQALAALTAAGQGWRPIETAPKNGYIIGAWQDGSRWRAAQMFSEYGDSWVDVFSDRIHQPTHWVAPPSTEEVT